jgi:NADPH-dependent 2,4-dienoyl-CoA reductase/sulfur reductase-like enzyme
MSVQIHSVADRDQCGNLAPDTDVIIIGAGPAGMSAAVEFASAKVRSILLDMQPTPGGQIFRGLEANFAARPATNRLIEALGSAYAAGRILIDQFRSQSLIDYRPGTTVWDLRADGTVGWLRDGAAGYLRARYIILANGAMERPTPFPGWTLPGVMTAGAVQTLIKAGHLKPEGNIVLAGTGPLIFLLADQLRKLDVRPILIARTDTLRNKVAALLKLRWGSLAALLKGANWLFRLRLARIPIRSGATDLEAHGDRQVESVSMRFGGHPVKLPCDLLVVHDGIVPSIDLAHGAGLALEWSEADASWRPKTSAEGQAALASGPAFAPGPCRIHVTGDARSIGGAEAAIVHGRYAARNILTELGSRVARPHAGEAEIHRIIAARPFIDAAFPVGLARNLPDDATVVCRCEEVSAGALRGAMRLGKHDMDSIRGLLRCGMGPCQGRNCAVTLARMLAASLNEPPPLPFRARPPLRPLPLGALAALTGLDPELAQVISLEDKPVANARGGPNA